MHNAASTGDIKTCRDLRKNGTNVDQKDETGHTAMHYAALSGHGEVCKVLKEFGADVDGKNRNEMTAMHLAALSGHGDVCRVLKELGAKVDEKDKNERTAMHLAACFNKGEVCKILKELGAKVDLKEKKNGHTAMHYAALSGHGEVCKVLKEVGAKIDEKDESGGTPMHLAASSGYGEVCEVLKELGAKVDAKNKIGQTPMHCAAANDHGNVCTILKELGAKIDEEDGFGDTPLNYSTRNGHVKTSEVLKGLGIENEKEKNLVFEEAKRRCSVEMNDVYKFLVNDVELSETVSIIYAQKFIEDGYETLKSIANTKLFKVSDYISKKGHCERFQQKIEEYRNINFASTPLPYNNVSSAPTLPESIDTKRIGYRKSVNGESVRLLESILISGAVSSGSYILVDAMYNNGIRDVFEKVKVKLGKKSNLLKMQREYQYAKDLNKKNSDYFIRPYGLFSDAQLIPFSGSSDILSEYVGLVMELGQIDLSKFLMRPKSIPPTERLTIAEQLCTMVSKCHENGYIFMDFKPSNVVRIYDPDKSEVLLKSIDFDNVFLLNDDITDKCTSATPRYISPEIAKLLLALMNGTKKPTTKASKAIDIFTLGLIIWELENDNKSLWGALKVDVDDGDAVIKCAASLTDREIENAIGITFPNDINESLRSWLKDALKLNPNDRWSAEKLIYGHSFFKKVQATMNVSATLKGLVRKIDEMEEQQIFLINKIEIGVYKIRDEMIKKEDLKKYITDAFNSIMIESNDKIDSMAKKINSIANHQEFDSFDMKSNMKEILENLIKSFNAIGSVKSEIKDAVSSITNSVEDYKGNIEKNGKNSRDGLNEIKNLLDSVCSNMQVDTELKKKILAQVDNINTTLKTVSEKVDNVNFTILEEFGEMHAPRFPFIISDYKRTSTTYTGYWKNRALVVTDFFKLTQHMQLFLICESWKEGPCTETHKGYGFNVPGAFLVKIAPLMILICKVIQVSVNLGLILHGIPLPALGGVSDALINFSSILTGPLGDHQQALWDKLYAKRFVIDGNTGVPQLSDLVHYMTNDATDAATSIKDKGDEMSDCRELFHKTERALYGDSYKQLKELLDNKTTWKEDRKHFYLQKYTKEDNSKDPKPEIKWLCAKHFRTLNINIQTKDPSSKVKWREYKEIIS